MYLATDIAAIAAAAEAKKPRPIKDVLLEMYPDATIDRFNRAHAPYDGYTDCDGIAYRGGEYLPDPDTGDEDRDFVARFKPSLTVKDVATGELFVVEGTKGQIKAAREVAKKQQSEHDKSKAHVGTVGKREDFELTISMIFEEKGFYGMEYTHMMRDADNNPVVYKGSNKLAPRGSAVKVKATVKSHWTAQDGRIATYINRPKVL